MTVAAPLAIRTARALAALAVDPAGLIGVTLRARVGPVRIAFEAVLPELSGTRHRISPSVSDTQLFGGLNVAATLAQGRPITDPGLGAHPATLIIAMAERITNGLAARLGQILDRAQGHTLILLDEGAEPDEAAPEKLLDRMAFYIDLTELRAHDARFPLPAPADIDHAKTQLAHVAVPPDTLATLTLLAARFGIDSLRAPTLALRTARALAALDNERSVGDAHVREAAELVYPHRAQAVPEDQTEPAPPDQPDATEGAEDKDSTAADTLPDELLVDAVAALLPPDLLEKSNSRKGPKGRTGSGAGARRTGNRRGRPLPSRPGKPDGRNRIDPMATLQAAAPWQRLRRTQSDVARPIIIYPSDIRIKRFQDRSDRLLVFVVDASGSAAVARLSEAKGAVELLLAQAYAKRDQVALIAFRGKTADLLLPPTRSLVMGKRRLSALPGGGGTPLAAGLESAVMLAQFARTRGLSPMLTFLTDGRANVALDGTPGRAQAIADASHIANQVHLDGISSVLIDTALRPGSEAATLAQELGARYIALPRADAHGISAAVDAALDH
jgi:magnesium chelatase subunit D